MIYGWKLCNTTGTSYCPSPYDGNDVGAWEDTYVDDTQFREAKKWDEDLIRNMSDKELDEYIEFLKKKYG